MGCCPSLWVYTRCKSGGSMKSWLECSKTITCRLLGKSCRFSLQCTEVIPVMESVRIDMEIHPYESAASIIDSAAAWGVLDCICRKQKALIGDPCEHPVDVCMALSARPGAFDNTPVVKAQTRVEALDTLQRAAQAGLVHSVSNSQSGVTYICNCCTCSCGILPRAGGPGHRQCGQRVPPSSTRWMNRGASLARTVFQLASSGRYP